jgi:biopolymer transport protein ExbD
MRINLQDDEGVEVQMAPLIDCVFLLLIFFLVAATLKKIERELPLDLPDAVLAARDVPASNILTVSIDAQGRFYLGADPITPSILHDRLKQAAAEDPTQPVRINADRSTPWHAVIQVLELAKFEKLTNVRPGTAQPKP